MDIVNGRGGLDTAIVDERPADSVTVRVVPRPGQYIRFHRELGRAQFKSLDDLARRWCARIDAEEAK